MKGANVREIRKTRIEGAAAKAWLAVFALATALVMGLSPAAAWADDARAAQAPLNATDTVTLTVIGGAASASPAGTDDYQVWVNKEYAAADILAAAKKQDAAETLATLDAADLLAAAQEAGDIAAYDAPENTGFGGRYLQAITSKSGVELAQWNAPDFSASLYWSLYDNGAYAETGMSLTPLKANGAYQFCWNAYDAAGVPSSWAAFYQDHEPVGPASTELDPSVTLTVTGGETTDWNTGVTSYDVWTNHRMTLSSVLEAVRKTNPDAQLESLTLADLLAAAKQHGYLKDYEIEESTYGPYLTAITSAQDKRLAGLNSPNFDLSLYWSLYVDGAYAQTGLGGIGLEAGHAYQIGWDAYTTALAPTSWPAFYQAKPPAKVPAAKPDDGQGGQGGQGAATKPDSSQSPAAKPGWSQAANGTWSYVDASGTLVKDAWKRIGGEWYLFDGRGVMVTGWKKIGGTWYYLNTAADAKAGYGPTGAAAVGWQSVKGTWYYFRTAKEGVEGSMVAAQWLQKSGTWYHLGKSGAMDTGWLKLGSTWYYLDRSGAMATGWQRLGGEWYYLDPVSGAMQTGWYRVGGTWYYSYGSGAMAHDCWIGAYYLNGSGAWTRSR